MRTNASPRHLAHDLVEATDVRLVERRIDLVEQAERRRPDQESDRMSPTAGAPSTAGEEVQRLQLLAGGLHDDLDPGLAALLRLRQLEAGGPPGRSFGTSRAACRLAPRRSLEARRDVG